MGIASRKDPLIRNCEICHNPFRTKRHLVKVGKGRFCSHKCMYKAHIPNSRRADKSFDGRYYKVQLPEHPFCIKGGRIYEHRLIIEKFLGRYLTPKESVHHINEIKTDNRIENLYLFESDEAHKSYHSNIMWGNRKNRKRIIKSNLFILKADL